MVWISPNFAAPTIPNHEKYEGTEVDANVLKVFPSGTTVKWTSPCGASWWALLSKLDVVLPDGQEKSYFLKIYTVPKADEITLGEFRSSQQLAAIIPRNIPQPVTYGVCAGNPDRAFILSEFRDMTDVMPSTSDFVTLVAKIHQHPSPNRKFGWFRLTTFAGKYVWDNSWCRTWEEYFTRLTKNTMEAEIAIHGPDEELQELSAKILTKVIPRLIRPMETEGRSITPVLLHGDLWHGNVSVDNNTMEPVVYDPCCFYGHNEYDLGMWRASRYLTNQEHVQAYHQLSPPTEPAEDQDDRQALYAMRNDLSTSICWPANKMTRELAKQEMRRLAAKYGDGYEGYIGSKEIANASKIRSPTLELLKNFIWPRM
ncbi:Fructosamine kinase-domain-containing protein [Podospora didyma]|uniref:protein-ribulosamine 3-kinase n=1 Tax=Podospora didyma TaxID=330526 RepID=A0AAE0P3M2_9PEZI|nr:Fructosamine kinase-domain-containing protein [Podospora didyma]